MDNGRATTGAEDGSLLPSESCAMENAVYWKGRQVGIECAGRILWFSSAPQEVVAAYGTQRVEPARVEVRVEDTVVARNLFVTAQFDRPELGG
ncbi:hypothetical protein Bxe_A0919 [Paraburkholderia xenovorans LB400]|uniref:Uncharacterized protein n=2 Tax=Paraburkholderia xenovorans TaxID=36873 RepID=Q13V63_PARXL|nr:hypothetical protein Bxe_A0919 [Paraburkholderia xenovorans LB400]